MNAALVEAKMTVSFITTLRSACEPDN